MISIQRAEELKRDFTDKWVVVKEDVPELRRFSGLTGKVKTVNMNCRALVQFDNPVDISWYDIDLDFLKVVDEPLPKKEPEEEKKEAPAKKAAPKKPASTGGMSPLEAARAQGAAGAAPKTEQKKSGGEKKPGGLSPLELARQQGAAGSGDSSSAEQTPAAPSAEASGEKKLSPLELARQQGAAGSKPETEETAPAEEEQAPAESEDKAEAETSSAGEEEDTSGLSPLELARKQGAFKPKD